MKAIKRALFLLIGLVHLAFAMAEQAKIVINASSPKSWSQFHTSGTLVSGYDKNHQLVFSVGFPSRWNSYCASRPGELQAFVRTDLNASLPKLQRLKGKRTTFHTGYIANTNKGLVAFDRANAINYMVNKHNDNYQIGEPITGAVCYPFQFKQYQYSHEASQNLIKACLIDNPKKCDSISIHTGTWPYVFAANEDNAVAVTNWGDVLFHNEKGWCRADFDGKAFVCKPGTKDLKHYRGIQLYSSINHDNGTLLGEWPTGRLWKLGKGRLDPTQLAPYKTNIFNNHELQSMSQMCGDWYIGYWPNGEVYKQSLGQTSWQPIFRLFETPDITKDKIPYQNILEHKVKSTVLDHAFLGQRVSGMENDDQSLLIATSNLVDWNKNRKLPQGVLTPAEESRYGDIYALTYPNCMTTVVQQQTNLKIILSNDQLQIFNQAKLLKKIPLKNVDIRSIKTLEYKKGIFGPLTDETIKIQRVQ